MLQRILLLDSTVLHKSSPKPMRSSLSKCIAFIKNYGIKLLGLIFAVTALGCTQMQQLHLPQWLHYNSHKNTYLSQENTTTPIHGPLLPYTQVEIIGMLDVILHTSNKTAVKLHGDVRDTDAIIWTINNGILKIKPRKGYPKYGNVQIDLTTPQLHTFTYHGIGDIIGNIHVNALSLFLDNAGQTNLSGNLQLQCLTIKGRGVTILQGVTGTLPLVNISGMARVKLTGKVAITSIIMKGRAWLSAYWLNTRALHVKLTDHTFLQLAGIANWMNVQARNASCFRGRYLRATTAFVKTFDHASAEVYITRDQHTLASNASQIYFYNQPITQTDFMAFNGAVLGFTELTQSTAMIQGSGNRRAMK